MIPRLAGGWQTTMADLALILFIVSAAGLQAGKASKQETRPSTQGEAVAVYRTSEGAPSVAQWLADQAPDRRQHLTIVANYRPGEADAAAGRALALAQQAGEAGHSARIVLELGESDEAVALLAFDRPAEAVARSLQERQRD